MKILKPLFLSAVLAAFLSSVSHGAIYYINDGGQTNAIGSTFATNAGWTYAKVSTHSAYGTDYWYSNGGAATGTFTFQDIPTADYYVYAGWSPPTSTASRTQNGTITVTGPSGSIVSYPVNHQKRADGSAGSDFSGSGFFPIYSGSVQQPITLGAGSTIVYTDGTETPPADRISADVVVISTDLIIDDISTLTTVTSYNLNWNQYGNVLGEYSYGYHTTPSATSTTVFTYDLGTALGDSQAKELEVSWVATTSHDPDVTYRVTHAEGVTNITVNQRQVASGTAASANVWSRFRSLGAFQFDASSKLEVLPSGGGLVAADTIMLGRVAQGTGKGIVANFNGVNSSLEVDGYPGTAGNGWATPWSASNTGVKVNATTANPIEGPDDPYIVVTASGNNDQTIRRQYEAYSSIDPAEAHHVTWKWRFDGNMDEMDTFDDRIHFFGNSTAKSGTDASLSWLISYAPGQGSYTIPEDEWWFYDSKKSGTYNSSYNIASMVPTSIGLEPGVVYSFDVELFPETGTYNATISTDDESFTAEGMTFRNGGKGAYDWLHFGGHSTGGDYWTFSFDSVQIYVPEPSSLSLLILAVPCLLLGRRSARGGSAGQ